MLILRTVAEAQNWCDLQQQAGKRIGFVPTMGYLHDGHMSLVDQARSECDCVAASIFVNPTQFAANEDLSRYPRDFEHDIALLEAHGCDMVFAPSESEMYPSSFLTHLRVGIISAAFEGAFRPTHFDGVCLIVLKLLMAVKAQKMYLGQKDYQQTLVIRQMLRDLNVHVEVIVAPTIREADGLALSSRNVYLNSNERTRATVLYRALLNVQRAIEQNIRSKNTLDSIMIKTLMESAAAPLSIDYAACVRADNLREQEMFGEGEEIVCLIAVRIGTTRLIDNMLIRIPVKA